MHQTKEEGKYSDNLKYLHEAQEGNEEAVASLMENNSGLVRGIALRFRGRGAELEDLMQIGSIGMLKAIRSFDITRGTSFSTYAVPLIIGEIRRYLRDDGLIKVGRKQKKIGATLLSVKERYIAQNGREPQLSELAEELGISEEEAVLSLEAIAPVHSISEKLGEESDSFSLENTLRAEDLIERRTDRIALQEIIGSLPELWKKIIYYRYFRESSQQFTADMLGLSQVKISREEKKICEHLRRELIK